MTSIGTTKIVHNEGLTKNIVINSVFADDTHYRII